MQRSSGRTSPSGTLPCTGAMPPSCWPRSCGGLTPMTSTPSTWPGSPLAPPPRGGSVITAPQVLIHRDGDLLAEELRRLDPDDIYSESLAWFAASAAAEGR